MALLHIKSNNLKNRRMAFVCRDAVKKCAMSFLSAVCAVLMLCAFVFPAAADDHVRVNQGSAISPTKKIIGNEKDAEQTYFYNQASPGLDAAHKGIVIPVTVSEPGSIKINLSAVGLERSVSVYMYMDSACTKRIANNMYITTDTMISEIYYTAETAGTYYLYCSSYTGRGFEGNFQNEFKISSALYPSGVKLLTDGVRVTYYRTNPGQKHLFRYTAEKTGAVTVYLPYVNGSYVKMLNASQKAISHTEYVSAYSNDGFKQEFYVKKGKTYYFEVTSNGISEHLQTIKASSRAVRAKGAAKKSSAAPVRRKRRITGMLANGGRSTAWYRVKIPAGKKLKITVYGRVNGGLKIRVYNNDGKNATKGKSVLLKDSAVVKTKSAQSKKSVYYIKVEKANRYSSGRFTLRVKAV